VQDKKARNHRAPIEQETRRPAGTAVRSATLEAAAHAAHLEAGAAGRARKRAGDGEDDRKKSGHFDAAPGQEGEYRPFRIWRAEREPCRRLHRIRRDEGAAGTRSQGDRHAPRGHQAPARAGLWDGKLLAVLLRIAQRLPAADPLVDEDEVDKLIGALGGDRAARVAYIVATSANRNETNRASRGCERARDFVELHGTKTAWRSRRVPRVVRCSGAILDFALEHAGGRRGCPVQSGVT